jgi:outer membrane lipoprotein LolB
MQLSKKWLLFSLWLALVACEQRMLRPVEQYQPDQSRYQIKQWAIEGRVAVQMPEDSFSAALRWHHHFDRDRLELAGPFGQGRTIITVRPDRVIVDDGRSIRDYHQSAEVVFRHYFSVAFPVQAVSYWLLGVMDPNESFVLTGDGFIQGGWRVDYRQDQQVGDRFLPRKIQLTQQQTKIKIIIDQWKIK